MRIAVLGTGEVGRQLAGKLVAVGHQVTMGSRTADNADARKWAGETGGAHGTFADAAASAELVVNATGGLVSLAVLEAAGAANLEGKTVVDVSNALDFSEGFPPGSSPRTATASPSSSRRRSPGPGSSRPSTP